jgi:hypothetical protein
MPVPDEHKSRVLAHQSRQDFAMIEAEYTEWKMVKTRSALVLCFEVPLELQPLVQDALGTPLPGESVRVAIARLRHDPGEDEADDKERRQIGLAERAGILCGGHLFQRFLAQRVGRPVANSVEAGQIVRDLCGVKSRAEFDSNREAGAKFIDLKADYALWKRGEDA